MNNALPKAALAALQFEETVLPNGLTVRVLPMPGYTATHAIYATHFGSIHRQFKTNSGIVTLPAGIAHFLEHKMFENADGVDAFELYAQTGASANAYTGFEATSYIFTASDQIDKNLDILLSFVGHPHFTAQTVQKEQGIIAQEIKMYEDNADLRGAYKLLECLYHTHPVREEIAGTVDTIADITPEILYSCTDAFYTPANMCLSVAGNTSMQQVLAAVQRANLPQAKAPLPQVVFPQEPETIAKASDSLTMAVGMPMFAFGYKEKPAAKPNTRQEVVCDMLTELICGETSALYRRLYDEGLVQPGFGGDYGCQEGCLYFMFSGESPQPQRVLEELQKEIERQRREGVDEAQFETCKRMMYGSSIADLENVERVASLLSGSYMRRRTPAQELEAIAAVTVQEVNEALQTMLQPQRCAQVVVNPAQG